MPSDDFSELDFICLTFCFEMYLLLRNDFADFGFRLKLMASREQCRLLQIAYEMLDPQHGLR